MTECKKQFYVLEYNPGGSGLPSYIDKEYIPELPYFDVFTAPPKNEDFAEAYQLRTKVKEMKGDYFVIDDIVSNDIIELCKLLSVNFISIPLDVRLNGRKKPEKNYNLFYLTDYLSILDRDGSHYEISKDLESGKLNTPEEMGLDKIYYEKITNFIVKDGVEKSLFFCNEIIKPVCSEEFKELYEKQNLSGVRFIPIDKNFSYDAWGDD